MSNLQQYLVPPACRRYRLQDHPLAEGDPVREVLADIDRAEKDPEIRADAFGNAMLSAAVGRSADVLRRQCQMHNHGGAVVADAQLSIS